MKHTIKHKIFISLLTQTVIRVQQVEGNAVGHTAGRSRPTQLKYKRLTIIAYSTGGNVVWRKVSCAE